MSRRKGNYRNRRAPKRSQGRRAGIIKNRRNPGFHFVTFYDMWLNVKERAYCWWNRVPQGSYIAWDKNNRIRGHSTRAKRPWFK